MPNWCSNVAFISHENADELDKIVTELEKGEDAQLFESLVPNPSGEWNYEWSVDNWGTKWDASIYEFELEPAGLRINFDTAWSPPIEFYNKLTELGYQVEAFYYEESMDFAGQYVDGDHHHFGGLTEMTASELEDTLPTKLDEIYGISAYARDLENEESEENDD